MTGDKKPFPYLATPHLEQSAQFSPDGRWVAYVSDETGRPEIFVAPFPWTGARWQISTVGGAIPRWRKDGKELFFLEVGQDQIDVAEVNGTGNEFQVLGVKTLFHVETNGFDRLFSVAPDGLKFIAITSTEENLRPLALVENWTAETKPQ